MFNWGDALCYHGLCVVNPEVAMFFGSPIGGLVGVEGTIVSKSRSLKLIGDWLKHLYAHDVLSSLSCIHHNRCSWFHSITFRSVPVCVELN